MSLPQTLRFAYLIEPPFCYRTADGTVTGHDVEIARALLPRLGIPQIAFIEAEFADLLEGLAQNRWDIVTGLFITPERQQRVRFSQPIWALADGLLVRRAQAAAITGYGALAAATDLRLAVVRDQVQHRTALALGIPAARIEVFPTYAAAAEAVAQGHADAYASVALAHAGHLAQHPAPDLAIVPVPPEEKPAEAGGFAVAQSANGLQAAIDAALAGFIGSPEHRAIADRFGMPGPR